MHCYCSLWKRADVSDQVEQYINIRTGFESDNGTLVTVRDTRCDRK